MDWGWCIWIGHNAPDPEVCPLQKKSSCTHPSVHGSVRTSPREVLFLKSHTLNPFAQSRWMNFRKSVRDKQLTEVHLQVKNVVLLPMRTCFKPLLMKQSFSSCKFEKQKCSNAMLKSIANYLWCQCTAVILSGHTRDVASFNRVQRAIWCHSS